jgi:hypothetical protein
VLRERDYKEKEIKSVQSERKKDIECAERDSVLSVRGRKIISVPRGREKKRVCIERNCTE